MSAFFNPLEYPICLAPPPRFAAADEATEHGPFTMLLVDWLRPAVVVGAGVRTRGLLNAASHAAELLGFSVRCDELAAVAEPETLPPRSVDLLVLDCRELKDGERSLAAWLPRLTEGAVVLMTGTAPATRGTEQRELWRLLSNGEPHFTFENGGGLGVLAPGRRPPARVQKLFALAASDVAAVRSFFGAVGADFAHRAGLPSDAARLQRELKEKSARLAELNALTTEQRQELDTIHDSLGFRIVKAYWAAREAALPPDTRRGEAYRTAKGGVRRLLATTRRLAALKPRPALVDRVERVRDPKLPWSRELTDVSRSNLGERVLLIAELSMPQCRRYRVEQKVEMLEALGRDVTVVSWEEHHAARAALQVAGLVIFYRVPAFPQVVELFEEARRLGIPSFFDLDDLIFDVEEYGNNTNVRDLPEQERKVLLEGGRLYERGLSLCDHAIASTPTLAAKMKRVNRGDVHVVENCLDAGVLAIAADVARQPPMRTPGTVTIGYGSGTRTHDRDFEQAADALVEVLRHFPQARLVIQGYLELPASFDPYKDRVLKIPFLAAEDYLRAVASWDISIAPLEQSVFNDAKSNIKFLEASVLGVPSVCSPRAAFRQVIEDGSNGMLAETREEWLSALSALVDDAALRKRIGEEARRTVLERYSPDVIAAKQLKPVLDYIAPPQRRGLRVLEANIFFAPVSFGGATIVAEEVSRELKEAGCDVTVFTGIPKSDLPDGAIVRYEEKGLPIIAAQLPRSSDRVVEYENPKMAGVFANVLAAVRPNVVHFHSIQMLSASLAEACIAAGIPYIITVHDAWWLCERGFMVRGDGNYCFQRGIDLKVCSTCVPDPAFTFKRTRTLRKLLDGAALLLAPSEFQRQLYVDNGVDPARVMVNKNGIALPTRPPPPRSPGSPLRFAYLGGRAAHKGYFWLKEILESVPEANYHLKLIDVESRLGGDSGMKRDTWKVRGSVEVVPPYDQSQLDAFFRDIDVLLMPSRCKESFGLTVREALARNVWVITTDSGGAAEDVIEGGNGNVVPMGDTEAFRRAVRDVLRSPERLSGLATPAGSIRGFSEQGRELKTILESVARRGTPAAQVDAVEAPVRPVNAA